MAIIEITKDELKDLQIGIIKQALEKQNFNIFVDYIFEHNNVYILKENRLATTLFSNNEVISIVKEYIFRHSMLTLEQLDFIDRKYIYGFFPAKEYIKILKEYLMFLDMGK